MKVVSATQLFGAGIDKLSVPQEPITEDQAIGSNPSALRLSVVLSNDLPTIVEVLEEVDELEITRLSSKSTSDREKMLIEMATMSLVSPDEIKLLTKASNDLKLKDMLTAVICDTFPDSVSFIESCFDCGWINRDEASLCHKRLELLVRRSGLETQIREQSKIKKNVDNAQERIRKNIETLSKDGLRDNPVVTKYLTALSLEEDKYATSTAKETELEVEKSAVSAEIEIVTASVKKNLQARYLCPAHLD
jgi:hypothetical protein